MVGFEILSFKVSLSRSNSYFLTCSDRYSLTILFAKTDLLYGLSKPSTVSGLL